MSLLLRLAMDMDKEHVIRIFNHYVEHGYSTYFSHLLPVQAWEKLLASCIGGNLFVAEASDGEVVGFAMLKHFMTGDTFDRTAEVSYFIDPRFIKQGLGKLFLHTLEHTAIELKISTLVANVSSLNQISLDFHLNNGFIQVGKLEEVGVKNGKVFDLVWFQKKLMNSEK